MGLILSPADFADEKLLEIRTIIKDKNLKPELLFLSESEDDNSYIKGLSRDCSKVGINFRTESAIKLPKENLGTIKKNILLAPVIPFICSSSYIRDGYTVYNSSAENADALNVDVGSKKYVPATPYGVYSYLKALNYDFSGKNITIIGRSETVGKPLAALLLKEDCTITICNSKSAMENHLWFSDMIITAIDKIGYVSKKYDVLLRDKDIIDIGMGLDSSGKLCGNIQRDYLSELKEKYPDKIIEGGKNTFGKVTRAIILERVVKYYLNKS